MSSPDAIDRYFTEQIVGPALTLEIGPTARVLRLSDHGVLADLYKGELTLFGMAAASLWSGVPRTGPAGHPYTLAALRRRQRWLAGGAIALWTIVVWAASGWWYA